MTNCGVDIAALAAHLGMSYQGVKKVLDGKTKAFGTANNFKAAEFLFVSPGWLMGIEGAHESTGAAERRLTPRVDPGEPSALAMELARTFDLLTDRVARNRAYSGASQEIVKQMPLSSSEPMPEPAQSGLSKIQPA